MVELLSVLKVQVFFFYDNNLVYSLSQGGRSSSYIVGGDELKVQ